MSAKKRNRQNIVRRDRNQAVRSRTRTYIKNARAALVAGDPAAAAEAIKAAVIQLDKAAARGIIHPRNAARRKSRLMKQLAGVTKEA